MVSVAANVVVDESVAVAECVVVPGSVDVAGSVVVAECVVLPCQVPASLALGSFQKQVGWGT